MNQPTERANIGLTIYIYGGGMHRTLLTPSQAKEIRLHLDGFINRPPESRKGELFYMGAKDSDFYCVFQASHLMGYATSEVAPDPNAEAHRRMVEKMTDVISKAEQESREGEDWKDDDV